MIFKIFPILGSILINMFHNFGKFGMMLFDILFSRPIFYKRWSLLIRQIYNVGVLSLIIIIVSGLFIGMVLGLQSYVILSTYNAESNLGMFVTLSLLRELGPVVTAFLFSGCAGSSITAEIGLMKVTEQLSSMEMMAVDPIRNVVALRFWAGVISMPLLTITFISIGIFGSEIVGVGWKGIDSGFFWSAIQNSIYWKKDVVDCIIKSTIFSAVITWIAVFNGYNVNPNAEGVSLATTRTMIYSSLSVLGLDLILTILMFGRDN